MSEKVAEKCNMERSQQLFLESKTALFAPKIMAFTRILDTQNIQKSTY
jgi:hypothetical protein